VSVLERRQLEQSPLADLHALAAEIGVEGYRRLRREELISALLRESDGAEEATAAEQVGVEELSGARRESDSGERSGAREPRPRTPRPRTRRPRERRPSGGDETTAAPAEPDSPAGPSAEAVETEPEQTRTGVLHVLGNGSGFMRADPFRLADEDAYVSPAQIRRCELRSGDELSGPVRPPRRSERHPSLVRVDTVNGAPAEPPAERPRFEALTPVFASERLAAPEALDAAPFGRGSRVAIGGPPGAGATTLLQRLVTTLVERHDDVEVAVVLAGVRPEEVAEWRAAVPVPVVGGSFDEPTEERAQAAEVALERAKRRVEGGGHAAIVVDGLDALPDGLARRLFGAARRAQEGGSLTVIASAGGGDLGHWATTSIVLEPPAAGGEEPALSERSRALRSELLG
jgi:transcription termination factor Rho